MNDPNQKPTQDHPDCSYLLGSLSDYVDGELEAQLCAEIERHASGCENCRIVIDTLEKTVYMYQNAASDEPEVPEDVKERLFKCLDLDEFLDSKTP